MGHDGIYRQASIAQKRTWNPVSSVSHGSFLAKEFVEGIEHVRSRKAGHITWDAARQIKSVCMIIVIEAEVRPVIEEFGLREDSSISEELLSLATGYTGNIGSYKLSVVKVAKEPLYQKHFSGPTQSAAISALVAKVMKPDLVINFGTAGGFSPTCSVGDVILADGCLFLDRLRFKTQSAFEWGIWGGNPIKSDKLQHDLGMRTGTVASQIQYAISDVQQEIVDQMPIACVDMEAGPIAQIMNQAKTNLIVIKVISNGIYRDDPSKQEAEYHDNRDTVSQKALTTLRQLLKYLDNKTISDLGE